jgi:Ca2+-binding EF-hand superfamily protein
MKLTLFALVAALLVAQDRPRGEFGARGGMMRFNPVLAALDADRDMTIAAGEIAGAPAALKALDKNGDGQLTADELRPQFGPGGPDGMREGRGPGGRGEAAPPSSDELVKTLLEFDRNGDGKLSSQEMPERFRGMFDRGDRNKDNSLDRDELTELARAQASAGGPERRMEREGGPGGRPRDPVTAALDADQDGALSASEIAAAPAALKRLDKDGDGRLAEDEVRPNLAPGGGPRGRRPDQF